MKILASLCIAFLLLSIGAKGQSPVVDSPYHINGSAFKENCNCYTLTPNQTFRSGSVWNINKINLEESFVFSFEIYLGCNDMGGADGIAFVLQPISTNIGTSGEGLGFEGVKPSIGITIDTWQNSNQNDPTYDHIAIQRDGDINHSSSNNLSGPVTILPSSNNIEDCKWHILKISWDATNHILSAFIDSELRVTQTIDLVAQVFNNNPLVFWGFTGATGGSTNVQRFCTALSSSFNLVPATSCAPHTITLNDNSTSFGKIIEWHWDFGDGTTYSQPNPPPHLYANPGVYTVSAVIKGNNGCSSDTTKQIITIGSKPIAAFDVLDSTCSTTTILPIDISTVEFGTINKWSWNYNGTTYFNESPELPVITGSKEAIIELTVQTEQGCISDPVQKKVVILPRPIIDLTGNFEACAGEIIELRSNSLAGENPAVKWYWQNSLTPTDNYFTISEKDGKEVPIKVWVSGQNGCSSDTINQIVTFIKTNAFAGNDTIIALGQHLQLHGTGGELYKWLPETTLSNSTISDPVATPRQETNYILTAYSAVGCESIDTINVKVYKGPEIYMPTAFTPNSDSRNDYYRFIAVGMRKLLYFKIYNRFGQLVYDGLQSTGWDGTYKGKAQPSGNYVWTISGEDYNGNAYMRKGSFVLIR